MKQKAYLLLHSFNIAKNIKFCQEITKKINKINKKIVKKQRKKRYAYCLLNKLG